MIPAAFDYVRAGSAEEAISLIGEHGDDAKFLAGGHSLLPLMKLRLAQPSVLVDIGRVSDLSYIRDAGDHIAIGALTRHMDVETSSVLAEHVPLLANAASYVGDPQVRHRGTIGGSIAHTDPASDLPATTLALGATYVAQGPNGSREIAAADFYQGFLETASRGRRDAHGDPRAEDAGRRVELPEVQPPRPGLGHRRGRRMATQWRQRRRSGQHGHDTDPRHQRLERSLAGASIADAAQLAAEEAEPQNDLNASPEYRVHLAKVLVRRALEEAAEVAVSDSSRVA